MSHLGEFLREDGFGQLYDDRIVPAAGRVLL